VRRFLTRKSGVIFDIAGVSAYCCVGGRSAFPGGRSRMQSLT
jgi:hypothetical protein